MELHYYQRLIVSTSSSRRVREQQPSRSPRSNVDVDANGEVVGFDIDKASQRLDLHTLETESLLIHTVKAI